MANEGNKPPEPPVIPEVQDVSIEPSDQTEISETPAPPGLGAAPPATPTADVDLGTVGRVEKALDAKSQAGYRLAIGVGSLIGLVTLLLVIQWWISAPSTRVPSGFSALNHENAKALAEELKILADESVDRSIKLYAVTMPLASSDT